MSVILNTIASLKCNRVCNTMYTYVNDIEELL